MPILKRHTIKSLDLVIMTACLVFPIFEQRKDRFVYKPEFGARSDLMQDERIEKTVTIKAHKAMKYGDVIKVIDAVKGAGAFRRVLQIDDLSP